MIGYIALTTWYKNVLKNKHFHKCNYKHQKRCLQIAQKQTLNPHTVEFSYAVGVFKTFMDCVDYKLSFFPMPIHQ